MNEESEERRSKEGHLVGIHLTCKVFWVWCVIYGSTFMYMMCVRAFWVPLL